MSKTPQEHHNDGQRDASEGNGFNNPHGLVESITTWTSDGCKEITTNNNTYKEGYAHTESQKR